MRLEPGEVFRLESRAHTGGLDVLWRESRESVRAEEEKNVEYRQLGSTELKVSAISLGTWAIGGGWGDVDDEESVRAIYRAIDLGVNFFDTADVYGAERSEELLRKTVADKADEVFIATKFGRAGELHDPANYSEKQVRAYCEGSLKRLGATGSTSTRSILRRRRSCGTGPSLKRLRSSSKRGRSAITGRASNRWNRGSCAWSTRGCAPFK